MKFSADTTGVEESKGGGFTLIPEGEHDVRIIEAKGKTTSKGDPMVSIKMAIISGDFKDKWLFDNIVIPLPGSPSFKIMGRTKHFLHVIGQPYEGKFVVDSDKWINEKLRVKVKHKEQELGKYKGQMMATVDSHDFHGGIAPGADEEIPF